MTTSLPPSHRCHIRLAVSKEEAICPMWVHDGKAVVPKALLYAADWVFDLDAGKCIKNSTGRRLLAPLGVTEVPRTWLRDKDFVRMRPT